MGKRVPRAIAHSLTDHHLKEWCAYCLEIIDGRVERHHVLQHAWVDRQFEGHLSFRLPFAWTVPLHPECHLEMQSSATAIQFFLESTLRGARTYEERDRDARWFHDRGYYWLSVLMKLDTFLRFRRALSSEQRWQLLERLLASAAGIRGAYGLVERLLPNIVSVPRPILQLHLANLKANRGHFRSAVRSQRAAEELLRSLSHSRQRVFEPARQMRRAQLGRSPADARLAIAIAETQYSRDTGIVLNAFTSLSRLDLEPTFAASEAFNPKERITSWLYRAESWFALGVAELLRSRTEGAIEKSYRYLVAAQYVCVFLGLETTPHPYLPLVVGPSWDATPIDVLHEVTEFKRLDVQACLHLRREAIEYSGLFEDLLHPMSVAGPRPRSAPRKRPLRVRTA